MICEIVLQLQSTLERIEKSEILTKNNVINMAVINQSSPLSIPLVVQAQLSEINPMTPMTMMPKMI